MLQGWRLRDLERGYGNLTALAETLGVDRLHELSAPLSRLMPRCPDPDMALNNLERFLSQPAGTQQLPSLLESRARGLEMLLQLLGTSQAFGDLLTANPDALDMLRVPLRRSPSAKELQDQLQAEVDAAYEDSSVLRAFRRFSKRRLKSCRELRGKLTQLPPFSLE